MNYIVRKANPEDLSRIEEIYAYARAFMAETGNPNQWGKTHPPVDRLKQDILERKLHVVVCDEIHGVFYFAREEDPTYLKIDGAWREDREYGVIHRIAGDGSGGILKTAVEYAGTQCDYLRIDTHEENTVMQRALGKLGFKRCGIIYLENGAPRIAFDRV